MIKVAAERRLSSLGVQRSQPEDAGGLGQVKLSHLHLPDLGLQLKVHNLQFLCCE